MFCKLLGKVTDTDLMATLKRYVVVIFGENAIYVRPPSANDDMLVFRFDLDNAHKDVLVPDHKEFLSKWKRGRNEKFEGYDDEVESEGQTIDELMDRVAGMDPDQMAQFWIDSYTGFSDPVAAVADVVSERPSDAYTVIPATPETGMTQTVPVERGGAYHFPLPRTGSGGRLRHKFVFGGKSTESTDEADRSFNLDASASGPSSSSGSNAAPTLPQTPRATTGIPRAASQSPQTGDKPETKKVRVKEEPIDTSVTQADWVEVPVLAFEISDSE